MKKNILAIAGILLILLNACATTKNKGTDAKKNTSGISSVEIHRTTCFGKCPDYRLKIMADGSATYIGRKFAPYQGTFEKKISADKVQALFSELEQRKVDTCAATYRAIPDLPGLEYEIVYTNGKEQSIKNCGSPFAPSYLRGCAEQMDAIAGVDATWKKTEHWEEPKR